jgi:tRNA 2-thiouridine synthesizing protein A
MDASGADIEILDLRGEVCPFTFVRTKLRLEDLRTGARLRVLVDHAPATKNVPRSLADWGQRVIAVGPGETAGTWVIDVEKLPPDAARTEPADRRTAARHEIRAQVQILGDEIHVTRSKNLSLGGALLDAPAELGTALAPGAKLELVVSFGGTSLQAPARVIRQIGPQGGVGLVFEGLDDEALALLRSLIVKASRR